MSKRLLQVIAAVALTTNLFANELFIYTNDDGVIGENVVGNAIVPAPLRVGSTISLKDNLSIVTGTNQTVLYALSSKTFVQQEGETSVYLNEFDQTYENDFVNPENVIVKDSIVNFSVSTGQLFVIQRDENVDATVMTSLALVNFKNAKFFLKTTPKYTAVYVYEGSVIILETKGKKAKELLAGGVMVVTPAPRFMSPKIPPRRYHTMSESSIEDLDAGEEQDMRQLFTDLQFSFDNTIFVNYGDQVFGIKFNKRN